MTAQPQPIEKRRFPLGSQRIGIVADQHVFRFQWASGLAEKSSITIHLGARQGNLLNGTEPGGRRFQRPVRRHTVALQIREHAPEVLQAKNESSHVV